MFTTLISAADLNRNLHDPRTVIVDCRFDLADTGAGRRAYLEGHIPGAVYAHLDEDLSGPVIAGRTGRHPLPGLEKTADLFSGWGVTQGVQVVAYDDRGGGIAARLWWMLRWLGHEAVAVLDGGYPAWLAEGFRTNADLPRKTRRRFNPNPHPEWIADAAEVEQLRRDPAFALIDARAADRYCGEVEPIDPVAGHIPGAINMPFAENLREGAFKTPAELKERFMETTKGKTPDKVVFYCGSGVTACHDILAYAHAGLGQARLYPGSWSEWIADGKREVTK